MSRTPIEATSHKPPRPRALGSAVRALTLAVATLTTGLVAGVFYSYAVSVNLGLAEQPDAGYVAAMQAINERIQNSLFFLSFFGAVLFLLAALAAHSLRPRSSRFWLVALASALYIGGGFLLTVFVNVPLNEHLAGVAADASAGELARARADYEGPWDFWNGVRTVFSFVAFLALVGACLPREDHGRRTGLTAMLPGPPVPISWRRVAARWHDRNLADVPATRRNGPGAETPGRRAGRERLRRRGRGPSTTRRRKALRKERHSSHTLRHTFATLWLDTKEPVKVLQEILGHFRIDVTMNIYAHVLPHIWEQAMDCFERRLQSARASSSEFSSEPLR